MRAGDFIFVSGQVAKDENGNMCAGNIEDETRWTIEGIKRILALDGADLSDVVKVTVYLEDARNFGRYNKVFARILPGRSDRPVPRWRRAPSSSARSKWTQSRTNRDADEQAGAKCARQGWVQREGDERCCGFSAGTRPAMSRRSYSCWKRLDAPYTREDYGRQFNNTQDAAYLKLNPNGKVPTLVDGDTVIWESNTILRYLATKHKKDTLYPTELAARSAGRALDGLAAGRGQPRLSVGLRRIQEAGERARARTMRRRPRNWCRSWRYSMRTWRPRGHCA